MMNSLPSLTQAYSPLIQEEYQKGGSSINTNLINELLQSFWSNRGNNKKS